MDNQEIDNLIKKVQSGEIQLTPELKLELLKQANNEVVELNDWLKNLF